MTEQSIDEAMTRLVQAHEAICALCGAVVGDRERGPVTALRDHRRSEHPNKPLLAIRTKEEESD